MTHTIKKFVEHLQSLDERARRMWLVGLTAGTMVLVVGAWVSYMRAFVAPTQTQTASAPARPGFAAVFGAGIEVLSEEGAKIAAAIRRQFSKDHEIIIKKPESAGLQKRSVTLPASLPPVE